MSQTRSMSILDPIGDPETVEALVRLVVRLQSVGLLSEVKIAPRTDAAFVRRVAQVLADRGIARESLAPILAQDFDDPGRLRELLDAAVRDLEGSPLPDTEWRALVDILEPELLGRLVGVSPSSVRRYASGTRNTPDDVAERLHFVALVVGELAGAYNEIGVRRWFVRRRTALGGKTPAALMARAWTADDEGPRRVRALAESLAGSPAT